VIARKVVYSVLHRAEDVLSESLATPTIGVLVRRPATCVGRSVFELE
jgi:hypothetical protein